MKKRIAAAVAAAAVAVSLAGCGTAGAPFVIGVPGPVDDALKKGIELAVTELNENDGIGGSPVAVAYEDMTDAKVLLGGENGSAVYRVLPLSTDAADIADGNALRLPCAAADEGIAAANYLHRRNEKETVSVVCRADDPQSVHWAESFTKQASEFEITVGRQVEYRVMDEAAAADCCATGADLVFLAIPAQDAAELLRIAAEHNRYDVSFLLPESGVAVPQMLTDPLSCMKHTEVLTSYLPGGGRSLAFDAGYRLAYGEEPNLTAALGYDAVYLISAVLSEQERAGEMTAEQVAAACRAFAADAPWSGATGAMFFENGNPIRDLFAVHQTENGWEE